MSAWQPIETAPRDGTVILVWWPNEGPFGPSGFTSVEWCDLLGAWALIESGDMATSNRLDRTPTHWMQVDPPLIDAKSQEAGV